MKFIASTFVFIAILSLTMISCKKEVSEAPDQIPDEIVAKIKNLGFSTQNIQKDENGYLVEGDILLTDEYLDQQPSSPRLIIAQEEQYRTFNLVTGLPRTITVSHSGNISSTLNNAINSAISRYNAENLQLNFVRVSSGGDINIRLINGGSYIASAGFPTSSGDPYHEVKYNRQYQNYSSGFVTTVIAHELGHCIGFRHTDYMNRSFSCGTGGNEGQETTGVGAVHIPGTPTGPDPNSWMLACLSASTNRPFNSNDKTALNYLY